MLHYTGKPNLHLPLKRWLP